MIEIFQKRKPKNTITEQKKRNKSISKIQTLVIKTSVKWVLINVFDTC